MKKGIKKILIILGLIIVVGAGAKTEETHKYNVIVKNVNNNFVTIEKDNELYSFYSEEKSDFQTGELINITMNYKNEIIGASTK